ncbi:MAG: hypothetical protein ACE5KE_08410 [Methanosarcinales archaeon]
MRRNKAIALLVCVNLFLVGSAMVVEQAGWIIANSAGCTSTQYARAYNTGSTGGGGGCGGGWGELGDYETWALIWSGAYWGAKAGTEIGGAVGGFIGGLVGGL